MTDDIIKFLNYIKNYSLEYDYNILKILDVYYFHIKLDKEEDLYITKYGLPFIKHLLPENFLTDDDWFDNNSIRLEGTSCLYKVKTKNIDNRQIDIVIKWNRMGQDIPDTNKDEVFMNEEFNSPFEEFSMVMELRNTKYESAGKIITHKPLAIYVPSEKDELWKLGRSQYKMKNVIRRHKEINIDMFRSYLVIYEWIKGIDCVNAYKENKIKQEDMINLTLNAESNMLKKGFKVTDRKPNHIIIRFNKKNYIAKDKTGYPLYSMVDFELLHRTKEREEIIKTIKRQKYLKKQKERFNSNKIDVIPNLKAVNIMGIDYVYGHTESTRGLLWIVGKDQELFDYFLPERWYNTKRIKLSPYNDIYYTVTKDNIHLVWRVSKIGITPDYDPYLKEERKIIEFGYNSPFEEINIALELSKKNIRTIYPRAVYMSLKKTKISEEIIDDSRYEKYKNLFTPDNIPLLNKDYTYIIIWGYWNGPDEKLAQEDGNYLRGINALQAFKEGYINKKEYFELLTRKKKKLYEAGFEDLNLRGRHILLSLDDNNKVVNDENGFPETRICNFELLKRLD